MMGSRRRYLVLLLIVVTAGLALGSAAGLPALIWWDRGIASLDSSHTIYVEPGAEDEASRVRDWLAEAVASVEEGLGAPFPESPTVVVTATQLSFNRRVAQPGAGIATGAVFGGRAYLSPRAFSIGAFRAVLVHELTHLHFIQSLGQYSAVNRVPRWYQEGIAVYLGGLHGRDPFPVSREAAVQAIVSGPELSLDFGDTWLHPRIPRDYGLSSGMFYRQSGIFVEVLAKRYPAGLRSLHTSLCAGQSFRQAFKAIAPSPQIAWQAMVTELRGS